VVSSTARAMPYNPAYLAGVLCGKVASDRVNPDFRHFQLTTLRSIA
jgi:hypothetical protein